MVWCLSAPGNGGDQCTRRYRPPGLEPGGAVPPRAVLEVFRFQAASFFSLEGFICDNVVSFEVILASGDVVQANAAESPQVRR